GPSSSGSGARPALKALGTGGDGRGSSGFAFTRSVPSGGETICVSTGADSDVLDFGADERGAKIGARGADGFAAMGFVISVSTGGPPASGADGRGAKMGARGADGFASMGFVISVSTGGPPASGADGRGAKIGARGAEGFGSTRFVSVNIGGEGLGSS